jgi:NADH-quinone oxidoreductase subunit L
MYLAIVFLPLLGAVIAGMITLVGARNRLPGEDPPPPHDDHAAPLVPEGHGHGALALHAPKSIIRATRRTGAARRAPARRWPS